MVKWAIQRADQLWLAMDYGWTIRADGMLRFKAVSEADHQAGRLVTSGIACHAVAVSGQPSEHPSDPGG